MENINNFLVVKQGHVLTAFDDETDANQYAKRHKATVIKNQIEKNK